MKKALLVMAFLAVVWALPLLGQGRQGGAGSAAEQAAAEAMEAARKPPVEDFKPSILNQPGRQYPEVNSERRVRARVVAPEANHVAFELLGGVRYPLTKGPDGAWTEWTPPPGSPGPNRAFRIQAEPARQLKNLRGIPILWMQGENNYSGPAQLQFLRQSGCDAEFMRLRDRGIEDGNTNLMLLERNNFEVFGLIRDWLAQRVR